MAFRTERVTPLSRVIVGVAPLSPEAQEGRANRPTYRDLHVAATVGSYHRLLQGINGVPVLPEGPEATAKELSEDRTKRTIPKKIVC